VHQCFELRVGISRIVTIAPAKIAAVIILILVLVLILVLNLVPILLRQIAGGSAPVGTPERALMFAQPA
jgi:hypothetical protein